MKFLIIILIAMTAASLGSPVSSTIPYVGAGGSCKISSGGYAASYHSSFGGDWNLHGKLNSDGTKESFSGTVSDTTINGVFSQSDFAWASDGYVLCLDYYEIELAVQFTIKISNGKVSGAATYLPD